MKASLGAIILAAGRSSRMGRPKMLLPWRDTTVLGHLIGLWSALPVKQIIVVCASEDAAITAELNRLRFPIEQRVINPNPDRGMLSSIQCAAQWSGWHPTISHWAIVLGDQPHLQPTTLAALVDFTSQHPEKICQPSRAGRPRHPVLLPETVLAELASANAQTLKQFLQPFAGDVRLIEIDDGGLDLDIDSPEDYQRVRELYLGK